MAKQNDSTPPIGTPNFIVEIKLEEDGDAMLVDVRTTALQVIATLRGYRNYRYGQVHWSIVSVNENLIGPEGQRDLKVLGRNGWSDLASVLIELELARHVD